MHGSHIWTSRELNPQFIIHRLVLIEASRRTASNKIIGKTLRNF